MATSWDSKLTLILSEIKLLKISLYSGINDREPWVLYPSYLKQKVSYPRWDSTQCKYILSSLVPHKECTLCNVQSLLLDGFRRSAALEGQLLTHYKALLAYRLFVWSIIQIAVSGRNAGNGKPPPSNSDLPMLHVKGPSRLNNTNSQGYIKLSRLFNLLPI